MKNNEARKQQEAQELRSEWRHSAAHQGQRELMALSGIIRKLPALLSSH